MIDALFGSKTRVKLLHLFLNHPGQSFYVREITRLIDEQINSVRRELSNMLEVGVITSDAGDNKLYYQVNQRYEYYSALRAIFANEALVTKPALSEGETVSEQYLSAIADISALRLAILSGVLVKGSTSSVDVLLVGTLPAAKVKAAMAIIEKLRYEVVAGIGRSEERAILDGDITATHMDADVAAATDFRKAHNGIRKKALDNTAKATSGPCDAPP